MLVSGAGTDLQTVISNTFLFKNWKNKDGEWENVRWSQKLGRATYETKEIRVKIQKILENLVLKEEEGKMWRWKMTNKVATKEEESGDKCEKGKEESVLIDEKENIDEDDKSQFIMCWKMCRISFIIYSIICCVE